jgi:hypothetical protein
MFHANGLKGILGERVSGEAVAGLEKDRALMSAWAVPTLDPIRFSPFTAPRLTTEQNRNREQQSTSSRQHSRCGFCDWG